MTKKPTAGVGGLILQPESELTYEQDGLIRGQRILKGDKSFQNLIPQLWTPHPAEKSALLFQKRVVNLKLSQILVVLDYIGIAKDPTDFIIGFNGSLNREPIETHQDFVDRLGGKLGDEKNGAKFDPDTGEFICFPPDAGNDLGGVEAYFEPSVNLQRTWWTYKTPNPMAMGSIASGGFYDIIVPQNVKNFLWGAMTYRQVGRLYQCSQEALGSGRRGWNSAIYQA